MLLSFVPRQHAGHGINKGGGEEAPSHSLGAILMTHMKVDGVPVGQHPSRAY